MIDRTTSDKAAAELHDESPEDGAQLHASVFGGQGLRHRLAPDERRPLCRGRRRAGHHDRYWRGNSVKPSFIPRSGGTNLFDTIIGRHVATAPNLTIGATPPEQWKLFVNQVDTSLYSGILAQGFVRKPDLDGIRELARSGYDPQVPFSLMILMWW